METVHIDEAAETIAPDGSVVHLLTSVGGAGTALFELRPGQVARPVRHPRVEECWYVVRGTGQMWRMTPAGGEVMTDLVPGLSLNIPVGTSFQFRANEESLHILGVTSPPWNGPEDAQDLRGGAWPVHL
jgi:mannose-6-phosphate isomerase-like protein (cupin superfamily)